MNNVSPQKTLHIRKTKPSGSDVTVAYQINYADDEVLYGFAKCSKHDTFNRKRGHIIASGRLNSDSSFAVELDDIGGDRYKDIENYFRKLFK